MTYRLIGQARGQLDRVVTESVRSFGRQSAERYLRLLNAVFTAVGEFPERPSSHEIEALPGVRAFPLRLGRRFLAAGERVRHPRHIVVYRVADDGVVEILGIAHDRMSLSPFGRRAVRAADASNQQ